MLFPPKMIACSCMYLYIPATQGRGCLSCWGSSSNLAEKVVSTGHLICHTGPSHTNFPKDDGMLMSAASTSILMLVASASMLMPSFLGFFSPQKVNLKIPHQFQLRTIRNRLSLEDYFRQLVSSDPLFRFSKMTFQHHQITEDDFPEPSRFRLVINRNSPGPGKSSSMNW